MTSTEHDDKTLVEGARGGDQQAIESLLERYQSQVYRFSMKMCRDPEDAKDVLQETLLAMARTVRNFRGDSTISTWLYGIARSFCIKKRRKSKFAPQETSLESDGKQEVRQIADSEAGPEEQEYVHEVRTALELGIAALEPLYREVLLLRDVEGLTAPEVAEVLQISVAAVKSRLHRARSAVRDRVAPLLGLTGTTSEASCPDVVSLFSQFLEGEISATRCEEMQRHLEGCHHCDAACKSLKQTLSMCQQVEAPEVPEDIKRVVRRAIAGFVGELNP